MSQQNFITLLKKEFVDRRKVSVKYDFMFEIKRSCQASDLKKLFDGEVQIVKEYFHKGISVHSSVIRKLLQEGRVDEANSFLGREFAIEGEVISGQGLGKEELYPTLNLKVREYILPKDGVYATRTKIDKKIYNSVSFIGNRISTDGEFSIETHILDESILAPKHLEVFFVKRLRDNQKFDSLSELKKQINQDINEARESLRVCKPYALEFL